MKKALWFGVVLCALLAGPSGAAEAPLELPEPVIAIIEADDATAFASVLQATLGQIQPQMVIPSPAAVVPGGWLMTVNPASVDLGRSLQIVLAGAPPTARPVFVFASPDPAVYLDSLRPDLRELESADGLHHYVQWPLQGDLPEDTSGLSRVVIGVVGDRVCMGTRAQDVESVHALMESGALPADALPFGQVAAALAVERLLVVLKEAGHDPFALMRQMAQTAPGAHFGNAQQMQAQIDMMENLARQTDTLLASVALEPDVIHLAGRLKAVPDSGMASYLASVPREEPRLMARLPGDAFLAIAGQTGGMHPFYEYWKRTVAMAAISAGQEAAVERAEAEMLGWTDSAGPELAFSLHATQAGPLGFVEVLEMKDPQKARAHLRVMAKEMQALLAAQIPGMTIASDYESDVATDAGVPIDRWSFSFEFEPVPGTPGAEQAARVQQAGLEAFWGRELTMHNAFHDDLYLVAGGSDSLDRVKRLIEGEPEGDAGSELLTEATGDMPEGAVALGYLRLGEAMQWWMGAMRQIMEAASAPVEVPQFSFAPAPPIGLAGYVSDNGEAQVRVRVPTAALSSIAQGFLGGLQQTGQPPTGPPPEPVPMPAPEEQPAD